MKTLQTVKSAMQWIAILWFLMFLGSILYHAYNATSFTPRAGLFLLAIATIILIVNMIPSKSKKVHKVA